MQKILKITLFAAAAMLLFSPPGYSAGLPAEISIASSDKKIPLDLALEWLRGEAELPEEFREVPITVPLMKPRMANVSYDDHESQIKAISYVFMQYNNELDDATAREYADIIKSASEQFSEDPFIIAALVVVESTVRNDAHSGRGDYGLMQVRWRVHRKNLMRKYPTMKNEKDMFKPKENIIAGTEIFSRYRQSADGDIERAMVAYSGGSTSHLEKVNKVVSQFKIKYNEFYKG